ncbi:MAG TPA: nicotinate phosphoribosyltransferase [Candidatus Bathyarchaeota archaeon]|nr:nicotinate phosphoribosyltransferase [Candidatus Bathyarchaeota archaeon]
MRVFHYVTDEEVKRGLTTDVYFSRTKQILEAKKLDRRKALAEVTTGKLPEGWPWGVLCGVEEVTRLFEGVPVDVYAMSEGSIFYPKDYSGVREPVMFLEGPYGDYCLLETPLLGLICQASGVASRAARIKRVAGEKSVVAFGVRRMHPILSPMLDRAAYIGGFDGVSSLKGAEIIGEEPMGTMPHALIIMFGSQVEAWRAFDEVVPSDVARVALVDTYYDEKAESIMAAEALKDRLYGVRLDTPASRKGNFVDIIREVRWELDVRGYRNVKIFVSGGLDEETVKVLGEAGAEAFGVGSAVSNAPTIDFAMDIVELEDRLVAKRGKLGGKKQVWRCKECLVDTVLPFDSSRPECPRCGGETEPMLKPLIKGGKIVAELPEPKKIREYVLEQMGKFSGML